jgi:hypothetical protein
MHSVQDAAEVSCWTWRIVVFLSVLFTHIERAYRLVSKQQAAFQACSTMLDTLLLIAVTMQRS